MRYLHHIFICTNRRPAGHPRGCCADKGSEELVQAFKLKLREQGLTDKVRANSSGCIDACELGAAVVVYPEAVWYGHVTLEDVDEIVNSHIKNGQPVDRLVINTMLAK